MTDSDSVLRVMTDDGAFRVITASTTRTVRGAAEAQGVRGGTARTFGDLITGSILFRETMAPELRVQGEHPAAPEDLVVGMRSDDEHLPRELARISEGRVEAFQRRGRREHIGSTDPGVSTSFPIAGPVFRIEAEQPRALLRCLKRTASTRAGSPSSRGVRSGRKGR